MNMLLEKLNNAIEFCEDEKVNFTEVPLTYAELQLLRRYELTNDYSTKLASEI